MMKYDKIIIGAGIYGLYAALFSGKKGEKVLVIEREDDAFSRATYVNQARVHMGYHYPRSISTAKKSAEYFKRFNDAYGFSILSSFDQVYATSDKHSWTNRNEFKKFCKALDIRCEEVPAEKYFKPGMVDGCFLTEEYTYDAQILKKFFLDEIKKYPNIEIMYNSFPIAINQLSKTFEITINSNQTFETGFLLNATYASVNQVLQLANKIDDIFPIKYELCEVILCKPEDEVLKKTGLTVMDGPFFSIMPFGKTGYHSLTSVSFTPHMTSYGSFPVFPCQEKAPLGYCTGCSLGNCNLCPAAPLTAYSYMSNLAKKYMKEDLKFSYVKSLFSMKPILNTSEIDDSRPTVIRKICDKPTFISVLSGKINTVFDLDEVCSFVAVPFFKDGKLEAVMVHMNHSGISSEFEFLEECDMQAVLCEYSCDLFTAAESEEYMKEHGIAYEEFPWNSRYWYVFFAEEDSKYVYTLMLNQQYFDKEDIVTLSKKIGTYETSILPFESSVITFAFQKVA